MSGLEFCFVIPFLLAWLTLMVTYLNFRWNRAPSALEGWAEEGGYEIVRRQRRSFFKGPFFWGSSNNQIVYRIEVHDRGGMLKSGWVRIGSFWWPSVGRIDVRWDEPLLTPTTQGLPPIRGKPSMWDRELDS